jgi:ABC-2 type transport system permease protein
MNMILMPMWLLSGSFFPVSGASPWLRVVMLANPMTWPTEALRQALGSSGSSPPAAAASPAVVWALTAALAGAGVAFAWLVLGRRRSA